MSFSSRIQKLWRVCSSLPGGKRVFSALVGYLVPYSGSVFPRVRTLSEGFCEVEMRDRSELRNHLNSLHAIALLNVGELASGLALISSLDDRTQGIVTGIQIEYLRKARGPIRAEARVEVPHFENEIEQSYQTLLFDQAGEQVAKMSVTWRLRRSAS